MMITRFDVKNCLPPVKVLRLSLVLLIFSALLSCDRSADNNDLDVVANADEAADQDVSRIVKDSTIKPGVHDQWSAARFATAGLIENATQRAGSVEKGRKALLEEAYVSCGLPERVFRELLPDSTTVEIAGRTSRASGLPFNTNITNNAEGLPIVSNNCLTCHGTPLFGKLVVGLGNEFLDFTGNPSVLVERAGALVRGEAETRAWELFADRINAIAPFVQTRTVGVNPANNLTFALIAHRHADTNAWSDDPLLVLPPRDPPPVSVPPWWRMKKKPAMFSLGEGRLDHARIMMAASMLCSDSIEELQTIDAYAADIRAFIASLDPPEWPFGVDDALADQGREVFGENCSYCHGNYDEGAYYPARLVPIETVQTDSVLVDFAHEDGLPYIDWFNRSFYGQASTMSPGPGYVAPPLDGIWATAPFLHNGSVPSIRAVLDSQRRPALWYHTVSDASDPDSYDTQDLGWSHAQLEELDPDIGVRVYDTRISGYSNSGHQFGDHLSETERSAVLEYLKTL